MLSVVLRLVPEELVKRRLVGEAEIVESGDRTVVRSVDDLLEFLGRGAVRPQPTQDPAGGPA